MRSLLLVFCLFAALPVFVACKTTSAAKTVYRIKIEDGDTLASIAMKYDTTWDKIAKLNELVPGAPLTAGTVIRVEPGPGGMVAGAKPIPVPGRAGRLSRRVPTTGDGPGVQAASPDEFTEEDLPGGGAAGDGKTPKRGGLLFGGEGSNGASLVWPLHGDLSSRYGMRDGRPHQGIDIRAPRGTKIQAAGRGIVEFVGRKGGYGRTVIIRHGRVKTLYAHLNSVAVRTGAQVTELTTVGTVGTSGNASGPHLHFEVRTMKDRSFDPLAVLEEEELLTSRH